MKLLRFIDKSLLYLAVSVALIIYSPVILVTIVASAYQAFCQTTRKKVLNKAYAREMAKRHPLAKRRSDNDELDTVQARDVAIWSKVLSNLTFLKKEN